MKQLLRVFVELTIGYGIMYGVIALITWDKLDLIDIGILALRYYAFWMALLILLIILVMGGINFYRKKK